MTSRTDATGTVTNTFDAADRLVSSTDGTVVTSNTFDDAGRLTASTDGTNARSWAWDANSKIVAMGEGTTSTNQTVGPFGMPVANSDGVDTVPSMWDHTSSGTTPGLLEHGDVTYLTADESNLLAADVDTGTGVQREWLVTDPQGTPVTSTDGTGAVTAAPAAPDAFGGNPADVAGLGFLGLPDGADGNAALRARHMDPTAGGFLSPDPVADPLSGTFNLSAPAISTYVYGNSAPTVYIDPSGLFISEAFGALNTAADAALSAKTWVDDQVVGAGKWAMKRTAGVRDFAYDALSNRGVQAALAGMACAATAGAACLIAVGAFAAINIHNEANARGGWGKAATEPGFYAFMGTEVVLARASVVRRAYIKPAEVGVRSERAIKYGVPVSRNNPAVRFEAAARWNTFVGFVKAAPRDALCLAGTPGICPS